MVHALQEIRRVLVSRGTLIDLRPLADGWPVEVASVTGSREAGRVTDLPSALAADAAADRAMEQGERTGVFRRERQEIFAFCYSWDSPKEMQEYVEEEWADSFAVDKAVWRATRSLWAVAEADAQVRLRLKMLITRWQRTD